MTSILKVDNIQKANGSVPTANDLGINTTGTVLKMLYTQFDGTNTIVCGANTNVALTDLTVTVTPTSATSKFRLEAQVYGEWSNRFATWDCTVFFFRDTTKLAHPTAGIRPTGVGGMFISHESDSGSTPEGSAMFQYFDAPNTTSSITYKVGILTNNNYTYYLNRTVTDNNNNSHERFVSSICVTEIGG
tara:strand:+ start:890 stop:1456 length:567 start_codon:yes stop_codon:yes gene_type:complete